MQPQQLQSQSLLKLILDSTYTVVILYLSEASHNWNLNSMKSRNGIPNNIKMYIKDIFKRKAKPESIFDFLLEKHDNPPNIIQVKRFITQLKKSMHGPSTIDLRKLGKWLNLHNSIPSDNCKNPHS